MSRDREVDVHPSLDAWIDWAENRVAGAQRVRLEEHLRSCDACRARETEVRRVLEALTGDRLLEPSNVALATALRAFDPARPAARAAGRRRPASPGLAERLARLVFDSLARPSDAFAGARNAGVSRRLRFESGDEELDILVEPHGDRRRLSGQVLTLTDPAVPRAHAAFSVTASGAPEAQGRTGEHGEFFCEVATAGEIEIRLIDPAGAVVFRIPDPAPEDAGL